MVTNWVDGRSSILAGNASGERERAANGISLSAWSWHRLLWTAANAAWKNVADGGPFFRKVGGRERTALCYSADSLTCTSGFLEFLAPPSSLLRAPSSKLLISQIDSPIFPRICRYSHSHKCFFSLLRQDLYETSKSIVDPSFTDLIRQFDRA